MASVIIISGCPGTGKTTLCRALCSTIPHGLHLESDVFYGFPGRPIDPTAPESHAQNTIIIRALGRAASAFVEGGYRVLLDGVVGPWLLPVLVQELPPTAVVEYAVLTAALEITLERSRSRPGSRGSARVRHMHRAFSDLGSYRGHALDTSRASPEEVRLRFNQQRGRGAFLLRPEGLRS